MASISIPGESTECSTHSGYCAGSIADECEWRGASPLERARVHRDELYRTKRDALVSSAIGRDLARASTFPASRLSSATLASGIVLAPSQTTVRGEASRIQLNSHFLRAVPVQRQPHPVTKPPRWANSTPALVEIATAWANSRPHPVKIPPSRMKRSPSRVKISPSRAKIY